MELAHEVELPGNLVMDKLRQTEGITDEERLRLSIYIGTMLKRVPYRRRKAMEMIPETTELVFANLREALTLAAEQVPNGPELLDARLRELSALRERYLIEPPGSVLDQIKKPWASERMVAAIYHMTWRIVTTRGHQKFATCDNPAHFFESHGIATELSEIVFPVSTTHALHACFQGPIAGLLFVEVPEKYVMEFNRRLASTTERLAFYHREAPWLLKILPKQNPYLSRIIWK